MSAPKMVFEFEQSDNVLILTPNGPFMEFRDNDVRNAYNEAYRLLHGEDIQHLLIDFSKLDYFGSTFVGILIRLSKKVRGDGGEAYLCHLTDNMRQMMKTLMLLENTKTDFFWRQCENREAGLAALANPAESLPYRRGSADRFRPTAGIPVPAGILVLRQRHSAREPNEAHLPDCSILP